MTRFGQSCSLARRLVEAGVRFVTLNTSITGLDEITWDIHWFESPSPPSKACDIVAPMYDQGPQCAAGGPSAGMLDTTLVTCLAEFAGRTLRSTLRGRDHWAELLDG